MPLGFNSLLEKTLMMNPEVIKTICEARLLIGFLGEKHQAGWWDCSFLSPSSVAFLTPVYPNSILSAQYTGVCHAASRVHDEHIGIGLHYHLYRLPGSIERLLAKILQDNEWALHISKYFSDKNNVLNRLSQLGETSPERSEGPIAIGDFSDAKLDELLKKILSQYLNAYKKSYKTFPYMRCS